MLLALGGARGAAAASAGALAAMRCAGASTSAPLAPPGAPHARLLCARVPTRPRCSNPVSVVACAAPPARGSDSDISGDYSTDVDSDDECASAAASAAHTPGSAAAASYTARFTTRAELPAGALPYVLCGHACFGGASAAVMSRAARGNRWEVCVSVPVETELTFWLGLLTDDDSVTEDGPPRTLRARRRGADVAVRCEWGSGGATRVQVAHCLVTFAVEGHTLALPAGATLCVTGGAAPLGAWAPGKALPLAWAGNDASTSVTTALPAAGTAAWRSAPVRLPVGEPQAWRLAVRGADGAFVSEEPGAVRVLVPRRGSSEVTARWGEHEAAAAAAQEAGGAAGGAAGGVGS
jgi:hypothetical protein